MDVMFFVIGLALIFAGIGALTIKPETPDGWIAAGLGLAGGIILIVLSFVAFADKKPKQIEYPASEYTLELKVTEYQGQRDTTYVLIPKY